MKRIVLIVILISTGLFAQRPNGNGQGPKHEKIKTLKIAHITETLDLTSSEAEKFWPIYNQFDNAMMSLRQSQRMNSNSGKRKGKIDELTDKEANELIDKMLEMKTTELSYRKELVADLKGVLPPKKILKLQHAERTFKEKLLRQLRERKQKGK